jgi:site-specific DNA recombinase
MPIRAVIYARYSSENQREASIEDQVRLCREQIEREGWELVRVFHDAAASGGSTFRRRAYHALLQGAQSGGFEVVVAEALDRLSRDQEDVAALFKQMQFAGIKIITLAEGEISALHVGLKGTMNALFLKDLAQKTHRGLRGRIEAGKSAGGRCYGYDVVRRTDERGEIVRGERTINPHEAAVVQRIFGMFAAGESPIAIAKTLNENGVPGPSERAWRDTTIRGHALRGTGILRNELYIGRLVWNRLTFIRNPTTGRRVSRMNAGIQLTAHDVPALRIIDQELWDRVQARLANIRVESGAENPDRPRYWETRRPHHVLTGKAFCGCCNGVMTNIGRDYLACSAARRQGTCGNGRGIRREVLERLILDALRTRLMQPEHVAMFVAEFTAEWNRLQAETSAQHAARRRELDAVQRRLDGLIDAITDGLRAPGLQQRLDELETRKAELERSLSAAPMPAPRLHPSLAEVYRQKVENLGAALGGDDAAEAMEVIRSLIERVVLHPAPDGQRGFEIELIGEIAAMVSLGRDDGPRARTRESTADQALFQSSMKVVAGARNRPSYYSTVPI